MASFYDLFDKPTATRPEPATVHVLPVNGSGSKYALAALESECEAIRRIPIGAGRNHQLNISAFNMGQLVAAGSISEDVVIQALGDADGGLDYTATRRTIRSGLDSGKLQPRTVTPETDLPPVTVLDDTGQPTTDSEQARAQWVAERLPKVDWHAVWETDDEEEWIVEPLLPARRLVALYSAPKVGKSLLMLELAAAVCRGTSVLGITPDRPRRVLYVDFENDIRADIRERLTDMGIGPGDLDNLIYLTFPTLAALDSEKGSLELLAAALHYRCEVIFIDTVSRSVAGDENENDTWLNFYRHTGIKLKQNGIALIRLDHSGKDETKGQRGGSAKVGDVDAVWKMSRLTDDTFQLTCEANRMPVTEKTLVLHRQVGPLRHTVDSLGRSAVWDIKISAIIAAADAAGLANDAGAPKVREAARSAGLRAPNEVIAAAVKKRRLSVRAWDGQGTPSELSAAPTDNNQTDTPR